MQLKLTRKQIVRYMILAAILGFLLLNIVNDYQFRGFNMAIAMLSSLVLIYKSRLEVGSVAVFILLFFSLVRISPEYLFEIRTTGFTYFYNHHTYNIVITILMTYLSILSVFYDTRKRGLNSEELRGDNNWIFLLLCVVSVAIIIFGINRQVGLTYTVAIRTMYEYFMPIFLLAYYYSDKKVRSRGVLILLAVIYVIQDFYYGGRISSLQMGILVFILFFPWMPLRYMIVASVLGYVLLRAVGIYRETYSLLAINWSNLLGGVLFDAEGNYIINTFSEVLYSSSGLVFSRLYHFEPSVMTLSFIAFIRRVFTGEDLLLGNIVAYISLYVSPVGGGGFFPAYFFFWLGWGGVLFSAWVTVLLFNHTPSLTSRVYQQMTYILMLVMFPRWFYYTPLILFRLVLVNFAILYSGLWFFDQLLKRTRVGKTGAPSLTS